MPKPPNAGGALRVTAPARFNNTNTHHTHYSCTVLHVLIGNQSVLWTPPVSGGELERNSSMCFYVSHPSHALRLYGFEMFGVLILSAHVKLGTSHLYMRSRKFTVVGLGRCFGLFMGSGFIFPTAFAVNQKGRFVYQLTQLSLPHFFCCFFVLCLCL